MSSNTTKCPKCGCVYLASEPTCPNCDAHGVTSRNEGGPKPTKRREEEGSKPRRVSETPRPAPRREQPSATGRVNPAARSFMIVYFIAAVYSLIFIVAGFFLNILPGVSPFSFTVATIQDYINGYNPFASGDAIRIMKGLLPFVFILIFALAFTVNLVYAIKSLIAAIKGTTFKFYTVERRRDPNNSFTWFIVLALMGWLLVLINLNWSAPSFSGIPSQMYIYFGLYLIAIIGYIPITIIKNNFYGKYLRTIR